MWTQTSSSRYSRPLENHDRLYLTKDSEGREIGHQTLVINCSANVSIPASWSKDSLRQRLASAWQALRFQCPFIAFDIEDGHFVYDIPTSDSLKTWSDATLRIYEDDQTTFDSLLAKGEVVRLMTLNAIIRPNVIVILFRISHHLSDGATTFTTLNKYISLLASSPDPSSLPWGEEVVRLPPGLEEAACCPPTASAESKARVEKFLGQAISSVPALGLPCDVPLDVQPATVLSAAMTLSREETTAIMKACKARGYSITAAGLAALVQAQYARLESNSPLKSKKWSGALAVDVRSKLASSPDPDKYMHGAYVTAALASVDPTEDFDAAARDHTSWGKTIKSTQFVEDISERARQSVAFGKYSKLYALYKVVTLAPWAALKLIFTTGGKVPPGTSVSLSSVGVLDYMLKPTHSLTGEEQEAGRIEVSDVRVSLQNATRGVGAFMWVFRGQMELTVGWNEAFYPKELGPSLLQEWKDALLRGVGLAPGPPAEATSTSLADQPLLKLRARL